MPQTETRKLAAIMFTDIVGFSRHVGANEERALHLLTAHNAIIQQTVVTYHGQILRFLGDAFLVEFPSVVNAVQCAQQLQAQFHTYNTDKARGEQIHVRIGLHVGDVIHRDSDVFGEGANIAARLQELAEPDTICVSDKVYEEVERKIPLGPVIALGRPRLKNIGQRFPIYALLTESPKGLRHTLQVQRFWLRQLSRRVSTAHRVVTGLVLLTATIIVVWYIARFPLITHHPLLVTQEARALPLPDKPSIIVLPFINLSKDSEQDYFSDGLTEVLTGDLSRLSGLFVIARNSAFTYNGKAVKVQDVGHEMGVRYVLEGSVQRAGQRIRITAQLIDATTGFHLWSEQYDRPLQDLFVLQDEIVQQIVTTLKLQLTLQEQGVLARRTTDNLEAYDYLVRGVEYAYRFTKEANVQAQQMFEKALALDPQYAAAYTALGSTYYVEWLWRWSQDPQTLERAFTLAQQAVALDDTWPWAHGLLSWVYAQKKQYDQAVAEGERAIALDPNIADSYVAQAEVLSFAGRPEEASRLVERAMRLNPRYPAWYLFEIGWAYGLAGRYAEAITALKAVLLRNPDFLTAYPWLAECYVRQWASQLSPDPQTLKRGLDAAQRTVVLNDSYWFAHLGLGSVYLYQQQYDQALAEMERGVALDPNEAWTYAALGEMLSYMGRSEEALGAAEQALRLKPAVVDEHLSSVGAAYYLAGRPEEAIAPLRQYLSHYPNILGAHLILAAVYSELGKEVEARTEAAEVLRINPQFSLEVHRQRVPIKDPATLERHLAALRKTGLK